MTPIPGSRSRAPGAESRATASASVKRPARRALPATAASHPSSRTASRSSTEEIPPAATTGSPAASTSESSATSGPASEPSRAVLVTSEPFDACRRAVLRERRRRDAGAPGPAVHRDLAVPDVDRDDESLAEPRGRLGEERGRERRGSDHDTIGAGGEGRTRWPRRAVAAADLQRQPAGRCDALDEPEGGRAGERAVEVDEVEACGALGDGTAARARPGRRPRS